MLNRLLDDSLHLGHQVLEETRVRASNLLCKVSPQACAQDFRKGALVTKKGWVREGVCPTSTQGHRSPISAHKVTALHISAHRHTIIRYGMLSTQRGSYHLATSYVMFSKSCFVIM